MKKGIHYWFGYPIPNRERLIQIASAGFDYTSIWWGDQYADVDGPKEYLPQRIRNAGLDIEYIHTDFENANLLWSEGLGWEDVINRYIDNIYVCASHDIPTMVLHLTSGDDPPEPNELGLNRLKRLISIAERKEVNIAIENLRVKEHLEIVFKEINSDRLKFCYDSGHENCYTKKADFLDKYGDKLVVIHLHDNDGTYDQHCIPGEGSISWSDIMKKLKQKNYQGNIFLEVTNEFTSKYKDLSSKQFLIQAYKKACELEALYEK